MTTSKRLCIKSNILLFADLVRGNADAVRKIADLAKAGECNFIGVPKAVKPETVQQLQEIVGSDAKVQPVNFTIPSKLLVSPVSQPKRQQDKGFLHPKACALLFARLANGDDGAATTIALRAIQNECKVIGIPSNVKTQRLHVLEDACAEQNVEMKYIRFELSEGVLQKAFRDIQTENCSGASKPNQSKRKPYNKTGLQLDADGRDSEGRSRRKAHSSLSDEEKAERKRQQEAKRAERSARDKAERAKRKGGSSKD